jgi:hypothetical protein
MCAPLPARDSTHLGRVYSPSPQRLPTSGAGEGGAEVGDSPVELCLLGRFGINFEGHRIDVTPAGAKVLGYLGLHGTAVASPPARS